MATNKYLTVLTGVSAGVALVSACALADTSGPRSYRGDTLRIDDYLGVIEIDIARGGDISVSLDGDAADLALIEVSTVGGSVVVDAEELQDKYNDRWWRRNHRNWRNGDDRWAAFPKLTVRLPEGSRLIVDGSMGKATVRGDLNGPFEYSSHALDMTIGDVASADISVAGSGDLRVGDIAGPLDIHIAGAGDVVAGDADDADISIAGSGDVVVGNVRGGVEASIAGSGDIEIGDVNGPVDASINGSGDIELGSGRAEDLMVRISGSGGFDFDGIAVNPDVRVNGSGDVRLKAYEGNLRFRGNGEIQVGD